MNSPASDAHLKSSSIDFSELNSGRIPDGPARGRPIQSSLVVDGTDHALSPNWTVRVRLA